MSLDTGREMNKGSTFTRHVVMSLSDPALVTVCYRYTAEQKVVV